MKPDTHNQPKSYTTSEAAQHLGLPVVAVREMVRAGKLPNAYKDGRIWRIPVSDIEQWRQEQSATAVRAVAITPPVDAPTRWQQFKSQPYIFWPSLVLGALVTILMLLFALISAGADLGGARQQALEWGLVRSFPKAQTGETLIVVANFHRSAGVMDTNAHGEIHRLIEDKLAELDDHNIHVEIEPRTIESRDRARAEEIGRQHNAAIIIWGADTGARLEVNFLNLKEPDFDAAEVTISEIERTQLARPDAYAQFVVNDLPTQISFLALFAVGQSFHVQEQFALAIDFIQEAVNLVANLNNLPPELVLDAAYFRLGYLYQTTNQFDRAIANYSQAIALNPQDAAAFNNRGSAYGELGEYDKAIADYDQAIALDSQDVVALNNRGNTYIRIEEYHKAIADYNQAIVLNPQYAKAFNNRGLAYQNLRLYDKAIADYNQAIAINPQYAIAFYNLGLVYRNRGEYNKAIVNYDQAIALEPQSAIAFNNRGNVYSNLGEHDKAITDYNQAIALDPQYAIAFSNRGTVYADLGEYTKAIADYNQATTLNPQHVIVFYNRGTVYADLKEYGKAIANYDQAIVLDPQFAEAFITRGIAYRNLGEYHMAIADYDQAIALNPQLASAFLNRAIAHQALEQPAEELADLRRHLALSPDSTQRAAIERRIAELEALLGD